MGWLYYVEPSRPLIGLYYGEPSRPLNGLVILWRTQQTSQWVGYIM